MSLCNYTQHFTAVARVVLIGLFDCIVHVKTLSSWCGVSTTKVWCLCYYDSVCVCRRGCPRNVYTLHILITHRKIETK